MISVIIPVYNEERNIKNVFSDLINQTMQDYEAVFIDDGSTDETLTILNALIQEYPDKKIRVIHQENGGVSQARNTGLDVVTGEYIAFVDGDDRIAANYLEELYQTASEYDADWVCCDCWFMSEEGERLHVGASFTSDVVIQGEDIRKIIFPLICCRGSEDKEPLYYCHRGLMRKSIIDEYHIRFNPEVVLGEDVVFNTEFVWNIQTFAYLKKPLYDYYLGGNSATHQYRPNRAQEVRALAKAITEADQKCGIEVTPEQCRYLLGTLSDIFRAYIVHPDSTLTRKERKEEYLKFEQLLYEDEYVSPIWKSMNYQTLRGKGGQLRYFLFKHRLYECFRILLLIYRKYTGII